MALERGKYGVEYTSRVKAGGLRGLDSMYGLEINAKPQVRGHRGLIWALVGVAVMACASFVWTRVKRMRATHDEDRPVAVECPPAPPPAPEVAFPPAEPPVRAVAPDALMKRPAAVRNLLLRLEEAEKRRDVEMAVSTIEQIRALPGSPAADLDDVLARRLGVLNMRRLYAVRNAQWVTTVEVKRGMSASRIAAEHGSTLASLERLNGGNVDRLTLGQRLYVLDHPRLNLVIHRRSRTADLSLNGKFFYRFDITQPVGGAEGVYEIPASPRALWKSLGVEFAPRDRAEIEILMPRGAPVVISEM